MIGDQTPDQSSSGGFDIGDFLNRTVTPFAENVASRYADEFLYGQKTADDIALQQARNKYNSLNGSGAPDPSLALRNAGGPLDFLWKRARDPNSGEITKSFNYIPLAIGAAVLLIVVLLFRR